jgi:hypothetical protein
MHTRIDRKTNDTVDVTRMPRWKRKSSRVLIWNTPWMDISFNDMLTGQTCGDISSKSEVRRNTYTMISLDGAENTLD